MGKDIEGGGPKRKKHEGRGLHDEAAKKDEGPMGKKAGKTTGAVNRMAKQIMRGGVAKGGKMKPGSPGGY